MQSGIVDRTSAVPNGSVSPPPPYLHPFPTAGATTIALKTPPKNTAMPPPSLSMVEQESPIRGRHVDFEPGD